MCQSYIRPCSCGKNAAEMMFGSMVLDESVVKALYCPECSGRAEKDPVELLEDNGWILQLDKDVMALFAKRMNMDEGDATAENVFDNGFVTWVGMTPDDNQTRGKERDIIMAKFENDRLAQFQALKEWAIGREKRFVAEGWRKARPAA
ncbi:MAG: hypothetical protein C0608_11080 [Deltaproteobacteria bacterium]|nr:MAG: hypothetical protein C0608_11080 [Deltaproteobacteria bacterium]